MRFFRNAAVVAVIAGLVSVGAASAAAADTVIQGCTIVDNPTQVHHTALPGADLNHVQLSGLDLSLARTYTVPSSATPANWTSPICRTLTYPARPFSVALSATLTCPAPT